MCEEYDVNTIQVMANMFFLQFHNIKQRMEVSRTLFYIQAFKCEHFMDPSVLG